MFKSILEIAQIKNSGKHGAWSSRNFGNILKTFYFFDIINHTRI